MECLTFLFFSSACYVNIHFFEIMFVFIFSFFILKSVHGKISPNNSLFKDLSECANQTCVYGQCINDKCICDPGVKGDTCNMDITDCDTESCLNNGTCIELVNGFACQCLTDFNGPRCQYRRAINDNHCKKKCFNNGKCVVINNTERCLCLSRYSGSDCNNSHSLPTVRKCSLLRFRNNRNDGRCLAIGLTPLFDVHCKCHYDDENKQFMNCQIIPSPYSSEI
jgi:hypothetical protein